MSKPRRVILKLSGEALAGESRFGFDEVSVRAVAAQVLPAVREGVQLAVVIGGAMGVFAPQLVAVFAADDAEILRLGSLMIRTQCVTMFFHVWVMIINGLFQALGRALPAAILGLSRQAICLIPAVIVLSLLFGVNGLAVSQATADVLSMAIAVPMVIAITREIRRRAEAEPPCGDGEAETPAS